MPSTKTNTGVLLVMNEPDLNPKCSRCKERKARELFRKASYIPRGVRYACKACLKKTEVYHRPSCLECHKARVLNLNGLCMGCNKRFGLKQCKICERILLRLINFNERSKTCLICLSSGYVALSPEVQALLLLREEEK